MGTKYYTDAEFRHRTAWLKLRSAYSCKLDWQRTRERIFFAWLAEYTYD